MKRAALDRALYVLILGLATSATACAPSQVDGGALSSGSGNGNGSGGASSGGSGNGGEGDLFDAGIQDSGPDPDAACGLITEQAKSTPLHLYIAFDRSSSMVGDKWNSAKAGLAAFLNDPDASGVRVGLNFFPIAGAGCDQFAYKEPLVPFGELPQNAAPITQAMNAAAPDGTSTPIHPALGGAILKGIEIAKNNPGHSAAVLLVTDGQPQGPAPICAGSNPEDPQVIADLAAAGAKYNPPVRTFVIGLPGVDQATANKIAASGGTDAAILVSAGNVKTEFQNALAKVRGEALPCEFEIPEKVAGGEVDPGFVNVLFTPGGGEAVILPQDPGCAGEGWHYDDPVKPAHILFCPASCSVVKKDYDAKVQILLGCKTEVVN